LNSVLCEQLRDLLFGYLRKNGRGGVYAERDAYKTVFCLSRIWKIALFGLV
jgi:hypothetical protein